VVAKSTVLLNFNDVAEHNEVGDFEHVAEINK